MTIPKVRGIGRDHENEHSLCLYLERKPTDDEMRQIQDVLNGRYTIPPLVVPLNDRDKNNIYECISEAVQMESADDIRALSIAIVKADGNLRTLTAVAEGGFKLHLVAAASIAHHEALALMKVERDPGDIMVKAP